MRPVHASGRVFHAWKRVLHRSFRKSTAVTTYNNNFEVAVGLIAKSPNYVTMTERHSGTIKAIGSATHLLGAVWIGLAAIL